MAPSLNKHNLIITYNILSHHLGHYDIDKIEHWDNRKQFVMEVIERNREIESFPTIIFLQEATLVQTADMIRFLGDEFEMVSVINKTGQFLSKAALESIADPQQIKVTNTIFFQKQYWQQQGDAIVEWFSETPHQASPLPGGPHPVYKTMLAIQLKDRDEKHCWFINTHLTYRKDTQAYSALKLVDFTQRITGNGQSLFILAGDMNTFPHPHGQEVYDIIMNSGLPIVDPIHVDQTPRCLSNTTFFGFPHDAHRAVIVEDHSKFFFADNLLDHIFCHAKITCKAAWSDIGLINTQTHCLIPINGSCEYLEQDLPRSYASDHAAKCLIFEI